MLVSILENNFFLAGMPSPLPDDFRALPVFSGSIRQRLESISFFLFAFLCMTVFVQFLWNSLAKDFPKLLPRMRFSQALAFVLLLGTLFVIVLTMISERGIVDARCLEEDRLDLHIAPRGTTR